MDEQKIREIIRDELSDIIKKNKLVFPYPMQILDGNDITLAQLIGTRIGTATTQKLAFLGSIPRVQWPNIPHPNIQLAAYSQANAESLRSTIESLMDLCKAFGLLAP